MGASLLVLLLLAVLVHRVSEVVRGTPVEVVVAAGGLRVGDPTFPERAAALSDTDVRPGHVVELLVDDAVYERMLPELGTARASITFMTYYCKDGEIGRRLASVLAERARAGVRVRFLGDDFGCGDLLGPMSDSLRAAGGEIAAFRPVRWYALHRAQHRMHARTVVIDGSVGYTGGFGVDDKWVADQPGDPMWRETSVRVVGPAVRTMQATFAAAWTEASGALIAGDAYFAPADAPAAAPAVRAGFLRSRPGMGPTAAERYMALTVAGAERTLYLANSYFVPTPELEAQLLDASARGVDVRLLVPGPITDVPTVRWAGRAAYEALLQGGVRIWEYRPSMMHAKTLVADGLWASVGSLNLDNRSLRLNQEAALLVYDSVFGARMDSLFLADLAEAREVTLEAHRARPLRLKILDALVALLAPLL